MKSLAYILAIYISVLNLMPCSDAVSITNHQAEAEIVQLNEAHNHQDSCTPFCQCQCCQINVIKMENPLIQFVTEPAYTKSFIHLASAGWELPHSFLQPPQV